MDPTKQQEVMRLQQMQGHMERLSEQQELLQQQLLDIEISKNALLELEKTPVGSEVLTQVANGVFIKTKLQENSKFIVNIGANTTAEKNTSELVALYEEQEAKMLGSLKEIEDAIQQISGDILAKISKLEEAEGRK